MRKEVSDDYICNYYDRNNSWNNIINDDDRKFNTLLFRDIVYTIQGHKYYMIKLRRKDKSKRRDRLVKEVIAR